MPNYRYNDYGRRSYSGRMMPDMAEKNGCQVTKRSENKECEKPMSCGGVDDMPIAMAYVPWQRWRDLYEVEKGFHNGTIFKELDKPFRGMGGCRR